MVECHLPKSCIWYIDKMDTYEQKRKELVKFLIDDVNSERLPENQIHSEDELDYETRAELGVIDSLKRKADYLLNNSNVFTKDGDIADIKNHIRIYELAIRQADADGYDDEKKESEMFLNLLKEATKGVVNEFIQESTMDKDVKEKEDKLWGAI